MSDPDALREYATAHEGDIDHVVEKLRSHKIDDDEISRVMDLMRNETTALIPGAGFSIFRDFENHYAVRFEGESDRAA